MRRGLLVFAVAALLAPVAMADDLNPPPWRGESGTTFQHWTFDEGPYEQPIEPDLVDNPYGDEGGPLLDSMFGDYEVLESFAGRDGVLHAFNWEELEVFIPNQPIENDYKELILQVVWHWDGPPGYSWFPQGTIVDSELSVSLGDNWYYDYIHYHYDYNPDSELLTLSNDFGDIYIDQIVIDTICAPEPASLSLLALGGFLALRRRS